MQNDDGNDGTMVIKAQELLTAQDCERIIRSDGCLLGYGWLQGQEPPPTIREQVKKFAVSVRLTALLYGNLGPEEQQWMCDGLLQISQEIADSGYLTKYGVYTTEEQKHGCVIEFWPNQVQHPGTFTVPRRFADLMAKKFEQRMAKHYEADKC